MPRLIKARNTDTDYPSNSGKKWTDEEDAILLDELKKNIHIDKIAENHKRTTGGIGARYNEIAYKMHLKNAPTQEILQTTQITIEQLRDIIDKKESKPARKSKKTENDNEISELKNEIISMKKDIKEILCLVRELHSSYEFESQ